MAAMLKKMPTWACRPSATIQHRSERFARALTKLLIPGRLRTWGVGLRYPHPDTTSPTGSFKAAMVAHAWKRGGCDGGGHGYCDDAEERDGLEEYGTTRLSARKVVRAAKATRRPALIIGQCGQCGKTYKRAAALASHQASCVGPVHATGEFHFLFQQLQAFTFQCKSHER